LKTKKKKKKKLVKSNNIKSNSIKFGSMAQVVEERPWVQNPSTTLKKKNQTNPKIKKHRLIGLNTKSDYFKTVT
jgi:hypothetical protein